MGLGTFSRRARSLTTIFIFARVRILFFESVRTFQLEAGVQRTPAYKNERSDDIESFRVSSWE